MDPSSNSLLLTRSLDDGLQAHSQVVSQRVELPPDLLQGLQEQLQSLHERNGETIRELWKREDKSSEAVLERSWLYERPTYITYFRKPRATPVSNESAPLRGGASRVLAQPEGLRCGAGTAGGEAGEGRP